MGELSRDFRVDFVQDCGADPTGAADVGPALDKAFAILSALNASVAYMPQQTGVLYLPPGKYLLSSTPTEWIFNQGTNVSKLIVEGDGDASVLMLAGGGGQVAWLIANIDWIDWRELAVLGGKNDSTPDTGAGITLAPYQETYFRNVNFIGIYSTSYALKIPQGRRFVWDGGEMAGSGCSDPAGANLISNVPTTLEHFQTFDLPILDGFPFAQTQKTIFGNVWILLDQSGATGTQEGSVTISDCLMDEGCFHTLIIKGPPAGKLNRVEIRNLQIDCPGNGLPVTPFSMHVEYVSRLIVENLTATIGAGSPGAYPLLDLASVDHATVTVSKLDPSCTYTVLVADAACGIIEVYDSDPALTVQSHATRTVSHSMNNTGEVWISPTGNDTTGNGASDAPFLTIQEGIDCIERAGAFLGAPVTSVCSLSPGDYPEASITLPGYVVLAGIAPLGATTVDGALVPAGGFSGGIALSNLTLTSAQNIDFGAAVTPSFAVDHVDIGAAVTISGGDGGWNLLAQDADFEDACTFTDCAQATIDGVSTEGLVIFHAATVNGILVGNSHVIRGGLTLIAPGGEGGTTFLADMAGQMKSALTLNGAGVSYSGTYDDIPQVVILVGGAKAPIGVGNGGMTQVFTAQTDVTAAPSFSDYLTMPNGSFNGNLSVTGRMTNIGAGGGGAAVGDILTRTFVVVAKTVAGMTTYESPTDLYGGSLLNPSSKYTDPSLVGSTVQITNPGGALVVSVDTTLAVAGAGAQVTWQIVLDGKLV